MCCCSGGRPGFGVHDCGRHRCAQKTMPVETSGASSMGQLLFLTTFTPPFFFTHTSDDASTGARKRRHPARQPYLCRVARRSLVIADYYNHRVHVCSFSSPGSPFTTVRGVDGQGASDAQLYFPSGATLDCDGKHVTADCYNRRVQLCSASNFPNCTTVAGTSQPLYYPQYVAVDSHGDYASADRGNTQVLRCPSSSQGSACEVMVSSMRSGMNSPTHVLILPTAEYLIPDRGENHVMRCPASAGASCTTVATLGGQGSGGTQLAWPWSSAMDSQSPSPPLSCRKPRYKLHNCCWYRRRRNQLCPGQPTCGNRYYKERDIDEYDQHYEHQHHVD